MPPDDRWRAAACFTNLALVVFLGRRLSTTELGAFALLYGHYLLVAELVRAASGGDRRLGRALCDLGWGAVLGAGLLLLHELPRSFAEWAIGGLLLGGSLIAGSCGSRRPSLDGFRPGSGRAEVVARAAVAASGYGVLLLAGALAGLGAVGALWAVRVLFGPVGVVIAAGRSLALAELGRVGPERRARAAALVSITLALAGLVAGAGLAALPSSAGHALLGTTWSAVVPLLGLVAVERVLAGAAVGPSAALRAFQDVPGLDALRVAAAAGAVVVAGAGAAWGGAPGAAAGLAIAAFGYFAATSVLLVPRAAEPDPVLDPAPGS
ncbi:hypothetical protein [Actinomadura rupiterrae]|uniref:hypothetical protein n=1 Tax=Actinomadura rupiterrae TaxID=559627 RepID=UPI0020A550DF|nr:hypothetical protein [Actinomadura rupiterrae]MCP2336625.1 hypothetical protein [Actinomadura rupiterrae]